jgi:hypothetical protein
MPAFKLGDPVSKDSDKLVKQPPPVVLQVQPDSYILLETPEEIRSWEEAVRQTTGLDIDASSLRGSCSESCSAGCTDDSCVDPA